MSFVLQCRDSCRFGYSMGHHWSLWKKTYIGWIQWGNLYYFPSPFLWQSHLKYVWINKFGAEQFFIQYCFIGCHPNSKSNKFLYAFRYLSLSVIRLHTHFLKAWRWLLVLVRLFNSGKQEQLWMLLLHKPRPLQVNLLCCIWFSLQFYRRLIFDTIIFLWFVSVGDDSQILDGHWSFKICSISYTLLIGSETRVVEKGAMFGI